jgi:sugar phosphate isomerase/epimerase
VGVSVRLLFGTTSYVLPADLLPNVRLLAPLVDDIELILFEGEESNLPRRSDVAEMGRLAAAGGCGFTVHLPLDVGLGELDPVLRRRAQETCLRVVDLTLELEPHAFVAHPELPLEFHPPLGEAPRPLDSLPAAFKARWLEALGESLARVGALTGDVPLAVENLQFPFAWVRGLIDDLDLGVTFDVGHLLGAGGTVHEHLASIGDRLTVVHLHGFAGGRDHQAVTSYPPAELAAMLAGFAAAPTRRPVATGPDEPPAIVVSLEVFGWRPTVPSLRALGEVLGSDAGSRYRAAADAIAAAVDDLGPAAAAD